MSDKMREEFEHWYIENTIDYVRAPIGSLECALQWKAWQAALASQPVQASAEPVAKVVNKYGDPEDFAERELKIENAILQMTPIGTVLYTVPPYFEALKAEKAELKARVAELELKKRLLLSACRSSVIALAYASQRNPMFNDQYEQVSDAIYAAQESEALKTGAA